MEMGNSAREVYRFSHARIRCETKGMRELSIKNVCARCIPSFIVSLNY